MCCLVSKFRPIILIVVNARRLWVGFLVGQLGQRWQLSRIIAAMCSKYSVETLSPRIVFTSDTNPNCCACTNSLQSISSPWKTGRATTQIGKLQESVIFCVVMRNGATQALFVPTCSKICRIKQYPLQFISTFGRNINLSLEELAHITVFH